MRIVCSKKEFPEIEDFLFSLEFIRKPNIWDIEIVVEDDSFFYETSLIHNKWYFVTK